MQSVGTLIKNIRVQKKISKKKLSKATKIKSNFIDYLEEERWELLPEYPVTVGFVKNISSYLNINEAKALALLRRDFPQKDLRINPKPEVSSRFVWGPHTTFILGIFILSMLILGYLFYQYYNFIRPPEINIISPSPDQVINGKVVVVEGRTDREANLTINNQPVSINEDGSFKSEISIFEGTTQIEFVAKKRSGKETTIIRKIIPRF
jgi:cytoskeletal protein RodZ